MTVGCDAIITGQTYLFVHLFYLLLLLQAFVAASFPEDCPDFPLININGFLTSCCSLWDYPLSSTVLVAKPPEHVQIYISDLGDHCVWPLPFKNERHFLQTKKKFYPKKCSIPGNKTVK